MRAAQINAPCSPVQKTATVVDLAVIAQLRTARRDDLVPERGANSGRTDSSICHRVVGSTSDAPVMRDAAVPAVCAFPLALERRGQRSSLRVS